MIKNDDGQLKITYYSESDVEHIQSLLITEQDFKFAYDSDHKTPTNFPKDKRLKDYELNISEIQNSNKINWDFERTEIVRLNQKSDSSYTPSVNFLGYNLHELYNINTVKVAVQINKAIVITIDEGSYNIPEGRAGPRLIGII